MKRRHAVARVCALWLALGLALGTGSITPITGQATQTRVSIVDGRWHINGLVTHAGTPAEGLLMNVRMVNAVFEDDRPRQTWPDQLPPDFDPTGNTDAFIAQIPSYVASGVRAFTISLQGGMPGYEGAHNSAFEADGTLRPTYLARVERAIRAADRHGAVVILSLFYQRQHGAAPTHLPRALRGQPAVRNAVVNATRWVRNAGFTNVLLEIANEYAHGGFRNWTDGEWLRTPAAQVELITLARTTHPGLLVSTSGMGSAVIDASIAEAADFVLLHTNNTPLDAYADRIAEARRHGKPVTINEDDKVGAEGAEAARRAVAAGAGWGFMHSPVNQHAPFVFGGPADDPAVYAAVAQLTSAPTRGEPSAGTEPDAPFILISSPIDGQMFEAGDTVTIVVNVRGQPSAPAVVRVEVFAGDVHVGDAASAPWEVVWRNALPGSWDLTAVAHDATGRSVKSSPVDIVVRPRPDRR
jgi:hypothetical protein